MANVKLFISYRRSDTEHAAQRVRSALQAKFGDDAVFIDREMPPGVEWPEELALNIASASAVIVMIGDRFVELMDQASRAAGGARDPLLVEIEAALVADKKIYPVVVGPRDMPPATRLPETIAALGRHNAVFAPPQYFDTAMEALIKAITAQHGWTEPSAAEGARAARQPGAPVAGGLPDGLAGLPGGLPALVLLAGLGGLGLWALGRALVWLWDPGAAAAVEAAFWHGARYALATALLGMGPYLAYWVVAELRARAWLPIYNVQGIVTALNMAGILVCGTVFLLLSTLPGWRLKPLVPEWIFPDAAGVIHYVALSLALLTFAVGAVAVALLEPRARRDNREGRPNALRAVNGLSLLLGLAVLWFAASLAHSAPLPPAQDRVPVIGYLMLCPVMSMLMGAGQLAEAHLGVKRQGWQLRTLFGLLVVLYVVVTLALFAYGPMRALLV